MIKNNLTGDYYIGQSKDLGLRFKNYFNNSYLNSKNTFIISRALIRYGFINFSIIILEYCDESQLTVREQFYMDKLQPKSPAPARRHHLRWWANILKIAKSSSGYTHSDESKEKRSKALKGLYTKEKSP